MRNVQARKFINPLRACLLVLLAGLAGSPPGGGSAVAAAAEAALDNAVTRKGKLTPALTGADIIYLQGLLEARGQAQNLPPDEARIIKTAKAHLAGTPRAPVKKASRKDLEERLKELLREAAAAAPKARQPRIDLALFYLYTNQPDKAARHLEIAGAGSQDDVFWPLLGAYAYLRLGDYKTAGTFLTLAQQAAANLLPLQIQRALFCTDFRTLGQYTPRASKVFKPGENTEIYVNIIGSRFKKSAGDKYLVDLSFALEIRDELQQVVWRQENYGGFAREFQHPVHDSFCDIVFMMPEALAPGDYVLVLTCFDRLSGKTDSADLPFTIAGKKPGVDRGE